MAITKKEILDYVRNTPDNTNINILAPMLDEFETGDNKEEIELTATENKTYTPASGKVYKKVTVNVPVPVGPHLIVDSESAPSGSYFAATYEGSMEDFPVSGGLYLTDEDESWYIFGSYLYYDSEYNTAGAVVGNKEYTIVIEEESGSEGIYEWEFTPVNN